MTCSLSVWHDPADEPLCEVPFDFGFEREESTNGMRQLIVDEVRSFRQLVRQQAVPEPAHTAYVLCSYICLRPGTDHKLTRGNRHELPPAPAPPAEMGVGVGPAFSDDVNTAKDKEEHPGSALERELEGKV